MDILLQYLNIKKQKQEYIKIVNVPCNSIYQSVYQAFGINMADRALDFVDYMEQTYRANYLFVGIVDAYFCNRTARAVFPYVDFCQLTCGLGGASSNA